MVDEISEDYGYLLGAIRDACVYIPEYELKFVQKNLRWLTDVIKPRLQRTFGVKVGKIRRRYDGLYELKLNSKQMVLRLIEDAGVDKNPKDIPPIIVRQPIKQQLWYVAGFDAEGDKKGCRYRFWQSWTDEATCPPLKFIQDTLRAVGIESNLYKLGLRKGRMFEFCLEVRRLPKSNLIKFLTEVPLQHPETVLRAPRKFRRA